MPCARSGSQLALAPVVRHRIALLDCPRPLLPSKDDALASSPSRGGLRWGCVAHSAQPHHPHPSLPLEGEGVPIERRCSCLLPFKGGLRWGWCCSLGTTTPPLVSETLSSEKCLPHPPFIGQPLRARRHRFGPAGRFKMNWLRALSQDQSDPAGGTSTTITFSGSEKPSGTLRWIISQPFASNAR